MIKIPKPIIAAALVSVVLPVALALLLTSGHASLSPEYPFIKKTIPIAPAPDGCVTGHYQEAANPVVVLGFNNEDKSETRILSDKEKGYQLSEFIKRLNEKLTAKALASAETPTAETTVTNTDTVTPVRKSDSPAQSASGSSAKSGKTIIASTPSTAPAESPTETNSPAPTPASNVPMPTAATANYKYGISMGQRLSWMDQDQLESVFDDFSALSIGWVRMDFNWNSIQPSADTYCWDDIDRVVAEARSRNIKVLPIISYTPAWARAAACDQGDICSPADSARFAVFAAEAVKRYKDQGLDTWEIWNEPNISGFWATKPDAGKYLELLKASYTAIKAKDPEAQVMIGGLSPAEAVNGNIPPVEFLNQIYALGGKGYFDILGVHPYTYPYLVSDKNPWSTWLQMYGTSPNLRDIMIKNGDSNKKIWLTEFGAPTNGPGLGAEIANNSYNRQYDHVSEALQAQSLTVAVNEMKSLSWAGPLFWYSYKDLGTSTHTNENFFGLIRYDGTHKPAYDSFRQAILAQ